MLLDSASLYFRAFFGVPQSLTAPDGTPVNAVRGFLDMVATLLQRGRPAGVVACWDDDWRPQWRVDALPSYKAHRVAGDGAAGAEEVPPALAAQVPVIAEALAALGIARVGAPGCEADDVIGTLVTRAVAAGRRVDVVTGDRDLFQLVDDAAGVRVLYTGRGVRNLEVVDQARLRERYGVPDGDRYADLAVLRGDPSDGLPGVAGIGEKTAAALLNRFGDLAGVLRAVETGDPALTRAQRTRLAAARDYLAAAPAVVRVLRDADLPDHDDRLPQRPADPDALVRLAQRWGVGSSLARVVDALG
ncbi:5'-3' exonuclease [Kineosporiaceae bacterium SCSIO 59966]|nr:5'-3' exonuclease [Kineosporiaceae bacterium SCSIO 59966]